MNIKGKDIYPTMTTIFCIILSTKFLKLWERCRMIALCKDMRKLLDCQYVWEEIHTKNSDDIYFCRDIIVDYIGKYTKMMYVERYEYCDLLPWELNIFADEAVIESHREYKYGSLNATLIRFICNYTGGNKKWENTNCDKMIIELRKRIDSISEIPAPCYINKGTELEINYTYSSSYAKIRLRGLHKNLTKLKITGMILIIDSLFNCEKLSEIESDAIDFDSYTKEIPANIQKIIFSEIVIITRGLAIYLEENAFELYGNNGCKITEDNIYTMQIKMALRL
jgi:hypothetical protein